MMLTIVIVIVGLILLLIGFIGCFIPAVPGPPLSFLALLFLALRHDFTSPLTSNLIILMLVITIAVTVLDYIVPAAGAKKYGSSKWGILGAIAGMFIGIIYFPPFGMLIGAFLGAVSAEIIIGKPGKEAMKAGWGVFIGTMTGLILKLVACGFMAYYFIIALF